MAMNFWEAQRRARGHTARYVTLFTLLTLLVAAGCEVAMRMLDPADYNPPLPLLAMAYMGITFLAAGFEYLMYTSYGGSYVAESAGGVLVEPDTDDQDERRLLNIVEEVSIASSMPMPPVYILPSEQINAFAAGLTPSNAAIAVTEGALMRLNRDELQGVIAHEFGHISNGDMKISMRLAAMVMGFFFVLYIALRVMQFTGRSRGDKKGNPLLLAAFILMVGGIINYFFGALLKCAVSREREYLADACAVQFTRNPDGISKALRKIGGDMYSDMPKQSMGYSHLYFENHSVFSSLFATHPPLQKRIAAIEGREYIPDEWNIPRK